MERWHDVMDSPLGPLIVTMADHRVTGVWFEQHRHPIDPDLMGLRDPARAREATLQLQEYFAGTRTTFDLLLAPSGTPFQQQVWTALQAIPYGSTASYGDIAVRVGRPTASRAVGAANGRNPISIIVPCHRVVGASGDLTGYGGGMARKQALLDLERRSDRLF